MQIGAAYRRGSLRALDQAICHPGFPGDDGGPLCRECLPAWTRDERPAHRLNDTDVHVTPIFVARRLAWAPFQSGCHSGPSREEGDPGPGTYGAHCGLSHDPHAAATRSPRYMCSRQVIRRISFLLGQRLIRSQQIHRHMLDSSLRERPTANLEPELSIERLEVLLRV